ncbi:MAG: hypothetical protein M1837_007205 [Sclerophora amabilis]|nr:MAG: hypothetical protein M1837_007205 [Sclerophora amabilis]
MAFIKPDGGRVDFNYKEYLGCGTTGLVLHQGTHALKIPKVRDTSGLARAQAEDQEYVNYTNRELLENEKAVYRRVGRCRGIATCVKVSEEGILLEYLRRGELEDYLEHEPEPNPAVKARWISSVIDTVAHFHRARVLIHDIALRNLLIADDNDDDDDDNEDEASLKMIDFGQSCIFPPDLDIRMANENGMTAQVDIFHLGCVIYSIAAWRKFECNLFLLDCQRPRLQELPPLDGLVLCREMVENCWSGQYQTMDDLGQDTHQLQEYVQRV